MRLTVLSTILLSIYPAVSSFTTQHHQHRHRPSPRSKSFAPSDAMGATGGNRHRRSVLMAVIDPPMPDKRKKNKDGDNDEVEGGEDWTPVKGGFLPNILRRGRRRKTAAAPTAETEPPKPKPRRVEHGTIPNVIPVDNIVDYKTVVVDEENSIVVVRFFASWCRSCKASEPLFRNVVSQYSSPVVTEDGEGAQRAVKFVTVQLTKDTAYLQEGLGVPSIPYVHVYHPEGGLVEEMKFSKRYYAEFTRVLESYVAGSCDLPSEEEEDGEDAVGAFE